MKCPHCRTSFHEKWTRYDPFGEADCDAYWSINRCECPECEKFIFNLIKNPKGTNIVTNLMVYPKGISRSPVPTEVPDAFAEDYKEACLVLSDSPKASAALSRRCLQNILRECAKVKKSNLASEIGEILKSNAIPSYLSDSLDAVRNIGNFAAHPMKSKNSGGVVDVEPGEAEWNLDVIEGLFDFYFVQQAKIQAKKEKLNKKLEEIGKPPIK